MKKLKTQLRLITSTMLIVAFSAFVGYCITYTLSGGDLTEIVEPKNHDR